MGKSERNLGKQFLTCHLHSPRDGQLITSQGSLFWVSMLEFLKFFQMLPQTAPLSIALWSWLNLLGPHRPQPPLQILHSSHVSQVLILEMCVHGGCIPKVLTVVEVEPHRVPGAQERPLAKLRGFNLGSFLEEVTPTLSPEG